MNKKYIGAFALAAMTLLSTGCSDFLDQDSRSNVSTDSFYKTSTGFESLTNSMYSSLRKIFSTTPNVFVGGTDLFGDGKSESIVYTYYTVNTDDGSILNFYTNCYKGIQLCNAVIYYSETTESGPKVAQFVAEARVIRAWYYFQLVQQFGGVPLSNDYYSGAVMEHPRASLQECYDFIISELEAAVNSSALLDYGAATSARANKRAANFLLAKAYLTRGWLNGQGDESIEASIAQSSDFANAEKYAKVAINGETPSLSIEDAFDIANESCGEFFWTVQYSYESVENPKSDGSAMMAQYGSYLGGAECPNNKSIDGSYSPLLWAHHQFDRGDGRYEQTFMLEFHGDGSTTALTSYFDYYNNPSSNICYYYAPWWATDEDIEAWKATKTESQLAGLKYISKTIADGGIAPSNGSPATYKDRRHMDLGVPCVRKFDDYTSTSIANRSTTCSMHDVSLCRLGEAYLIAAEAALQQGNAAGAATYINTLRKRPGTIKTGYEAAMTVNASDVNIDFILKERACELFGECVRWTDLKRTHKLIEYVKAHQEDDVNQSNLYGSDGSPRILRPYPQNALDLNNADVAQNPGW